MSSINTPLHVPDVLQGKFWFVISQLLWRANSQFLECWSNFLISIKILYISYHNYLKPNITFRKHLLHFSCEETAVNYLNNVWIYFISIVCAFEFYRFKKSSCQR